MYVDKKIGSRFKPDPNNPFFFFPEMNEIYHEKDEKGNVVEKRFNYYKAAQSYQKEIRNQIDNAVKQAIVKGEIENG